MRKKLYLAGIVCAFASLSSPLYSQESNIVQACQARVQELNADANSPAFAFTYLCDKRLAVVHPRDHDLNLFVPTLGGASTKTIPLEDAFQPVFDWLDRDYMQPTQAVASAASATGGIEGLKTEPATGEGSAIVEPELVLLMVERLEHREYFNIRYADGVLLEDLLMHYLLPLEHEDCIGVPCAYPGSCADILSCQWEVHVPLCEFINRGAAELLQRKYGKLPPAMLGLAEIVEVGVTGGHYAYRHWGDQRTNLPHSERDGYVSEFNGVLKDRYAKKKQRRPFLLGLLEWQGGHFTTEKYAASWGLGQTLLAHMKTVGRGKQQRTLGDLLTAVGQLEDQSAERVLEVILEFDPKFESTFRKKISSKFQKNLGSLLVD
jgi:hypothetical protein